MIRWLFGAALLVAVVGLPTPDRPYKVLMLLPFSSKSHRNVFLPLANALIDRGHQVTMVSNHPLENNTKIEHYKHSLTIFNENEHDMFKEVRDPSAMFQMFEIMFTEIGKRMYDDQIIQKLYAARDQYDIVLIDSLFNEVMFPFVHQKPFILVHTDGLNPGHSASIGNILNPAYISSHIVEFPFPYSFTDKIKNIFFSLMVPYKWAQSVTAPVQNEMTKKFPELPPLLEIQANASLNLLNTHFSLEKPVPLLPNQVEIGGMHCRPPKPLPKDLDTFISSSKTPVVYMSLGSVARSTTIPPQHKKTILNTFSKLPYRIVWKYEDDSLGEIPENVMIMKWMPQQDILGHSNVKAFISHCGLLGTQEAMYHATPVVGLPIGADQKKNAARLFNNGFATVLEWETLTEDNLAAAIHEVINNDQYKDKLVGVSRAFRDQLESPTDRAVFWTEYVVRHGGAEKLRSPAMQLSWIQLLHLDVIFAWHILLFVAHRLVKKLYRLVTSKPKGKKVKKQ